MAALTRITYCVTGIPSCCANPVITWIEQPGVLISCPPNSNCVDVSFLTPLTGSDKKCIKLFIACTSCGINQLLERDVCFCANGLGCGPCQDCGPQGYCVDRCTGVCDETNNICVDCDELHPCPGTQQCIAGKCQCGPGKPYDMGNGRCVECQTQNHCEAKYGKCYTCVDGTCVYKGSCGGNGVCDPRDGICKECVAGGDCSAKGDNFCCSTGNQCVCCPGFVLNPLTGKCDPKPECTGNDCGPCGECINGKCVPRQCPDGQICVNGDCLEKCDCNKPSSCTNEGKVCKSIEGVCVCVPCGNCSSGCANGCHCAGNDKCVSDKCTGDCTNGGGCGGGGNGCGCLDTKCVDCSKLSCTNGDCARALGCECQNGNCVGTGNKCAGNCNTKGECGDGCTCDKNKCVPCEFFSCDNGDCAAHEGCRCSGNGTCEGDPDYLCKDTLEIVKIDAGCKLEGQLTKDRECGCPVISANLISTLKASTPGQPKTSGTHTIGFDAKLFLGNNLGDDNWLLSNTINPDISINETADGGTLKLDVITNFQPINGIRPDAMVQTLSQSIANAGVIPMGNVTIYQMNGFPISSGIVGENRIVSSVTFILSSHDWVFKNTCKYPGSKELSRFEVITNSGFGSVRMSGTASNNDTRLPKFIWYKSANGNFDASTWFRTAYVPLDSAGKFVDRLNDEVVNGVKYVESCFHYGLKTDCSCKPLTSKYIVFCNPPDFTADIDPNSCGQSVDVVIGKTCHANKNKKFELLINGTSVVPGGFNLFNAGYSGHFTDKAGIKTVTLRMVCNNGYECVNTHNFTPPVPPSVIPDAECANDLVVGGVPVPPGTKVRYTFWKAKYTPTFTSVTMRVHNGTNISPEIDDAEKVTFIADAWIEGAPVYDYTVNFPCGTATGSEKKNCCNAFEPILNGHCTSNRTMGNLNDAVTYRLNGYPISKSVLSTANFNKPFTFTPVGQGPITTDPKKLIVVEWSKVGCPGGKVGIFPCADLSFQLEKVGDTPVIKIPPGSIYSADKPGDTYQIKVNGSGFGPYVPGATVPGIVGVNTVTLRRGNEEGTRTLEIRTSAACDIEDADVVVVQNGSKYEVSVPASTCPCDAERPLPIFIKTVTKMGDFFRLTFQSDFANTNALKGLFEVGYGANPFIKSGKLLVDAPEFRKIVDIANVNEVGGYVDIPCSAQAQDSFTSSFSLERVYSGTAPGGTYADNHSLLRLCMGWPSTIGTHITGITLVNNTNSQTIVGIVQDARCYTFGQVDLTGSANLTFIVSLSDNTTFNLSAIDVLHPTGDDIPFTYGDNEHLCDNCLAWVAISLVGVTFVDGCVYNFSASNWSSKVCDGDTERMDSAGYVDIVKEELPRPKSDIKVNFFENGTLIKRQFISGGSDKAILDGTQPANPDGIEYGKLYVAEALCNCAGEKALTCLKPRIISALTTCTTGYYSDGSGVLKLRYTISTAYPSRALSIYRNDGTLIETVNTDINGGIVNREVTLSEAMAGLNDDIFIFAQFDVACVSDVVLVPRSEVNLTWTRDCTNSPATYDIIFADAPTIEIISGTGTVVGSTIINIPNNTTIEFRGSILGCTSKVYTELYDCTIAPTPSITTSVTKSVTHSLVSVTQTRTITPSISTSPDQGGIVVYSNTPSPSPSKTPSTTPSTSLSGTPGASATASPSLSGSAPVTPSATPSPSTTPSNGTSATPSTSVPPLSATPTASKTPSITPTASITATATPTATRTASASPSLSPCNTNCASYGPSYTGYICGVSIYCCGGQQLLPGYQCCSGTLINPAAGDICCAQQSILS